MKKGFFMNLYVVRHGQTDWNIERRLQGTSNVPLNDTGIKQAQNLAETLKNIDIDFIFSSPLQRAYDTASIVNQHKGLPIHIDARLIERGFGDFEGLDDISSFDCNINKLLDYHLNYNLYHVEPIQNVFTRVSSLLSDLKSHYPDKKVLLATHGGVIQVIESIIKDLPKETNLQLLSVGNCEYRTYSFDILKEQGISK